MVIPACHLNMAGQSLLHETYIMPPRGFRHSFQRNITHLLPMLQCLIYVVAQIETVKFVQVMLLLPEGTLNNKRMKQDRLQQDLVSERRCASLQQEAPSAQQR